MSTVTPGPRHREDGGYFPRQRASYWWNTTQNPKPSIVWSNIPDCTGTTKSMDDVVVENYRERSQAGEIFQNPMASTVFTRNYASVGPNFRKVIGTTTYNGELLGGTWLNTAEYVEDYGKLPPSYTDLVDQTSTRARANVLRPPVNGLVSLGELGGTLQLLKNPFATGLALASQLQRNVGKAARLQRRDAVYKEMSNLTAQFMYGVLPLAKEVSDILLTLQDPMLAKRLKGERQTFRAAGEQVDAMYWNQPGSMSGGSITWTDYFQYTRTVNVRCGLLYEFKEDFTTANMLGFSADQVAAAAFQLYPLSFVLNWFVDVENFLRAMTPTAKAKELTAWTSLEIKEKLVHTAQGAKFSDWTTAKDFSGADTWERVYKYRTPELRNPGIHLKDVRQVFQDPDRLLGMVALTIQRLKGAQRVAQALTPAWTSKRWNPLYTFS